MSKAKTAVKTPRTEERAMNDVNRKQMTMGFWTTRQMRRANRNNGGKK